MLMNLQQHIAEFSSVLISPSVSESDPFVKKVKKSSKIPPQLAIDIYRNNTRGSRVNTLEIVYPACKNILGDAVFHSIAKEFVDADVIGASNLNNYGVAFDHHLESVIKAGRLSVGYSYLPDLAKLEYLLHAAYYADDDPIFDFEVFENKMQINQDIYFRVSESLALLVFYVPIRQIWVNNHKAAGKKLASVQAITEPQYLLIYREKNIPQVIAINFHEYQVLVSFVNNHSLQAVIDFYGCSVEKILPKLIANKWLTGIR